jgi:hypothetical protein
MRIRTTPRRWKFLFAVLSIVNAFTLGDHGEISHTGSQGKDCIIEKRRFIFRMPVERTNDRRSQNIPRHNHPHSSHKDSSGDKSSNRHWYNSTNDPGSNGREVMRTSNSDSYPTDGGTTEGIAVPNPIVYPGATPSKPRKSASTSTKPPKDNPKHLSTPDGNDGTPSSENPGTVPSSNDGDNPPSAGTTPPTSDGEAGPSNTKKVCQKRAGCGPDGPGGDTGDSEGAPAGEGGESPGTGNTGTGGTRGICTGGAGGTSDGDAGDGGAVFGGLGVGSAGGVGGGDTLGQEVGPTSAPEGTGNTPTEGTGSTGGVGTGGESGSVYRINGFIRCPGKTPF